MENVRRRRDIKWVTTNKSTSYNNIIQQNGFQKPGYLGSSILETSKTLIHEF